MQLSLDPKTLQHYKIFCGTPQYGGLNYGLYGKSCLELQALCFRFGIEVRFSFLYNESLIPRARNYIADEFLRSGFTHLLFIDADIEFNPVDVLAMMILDKDVIAAPYPKKSISMANIRRALNKNPNIPDGDLHDLVGEYVFNPVPGMKQFQISEPVEVLEAGTGFLLIKRAVLEYMTEKYPTIKYRPDHMGQANFDGSREISAYFDCHIDRGYWFQEVHDLMERAAKGEDVASKFAKLLEREKKATKRYLSEDYQFCRWWRDMGGKIWMCPWVKLTHIGTYPFRGNLEKIANLTQQLN